MLLTPELFQIHALTGTRLEGEERNILREVRRSLKDGVQEEAVVKAARELQKDKGRGTVKSAEWSESDGLLMFRSKIYVPNDRDLRRRIIEQHHDTRIAGHAGRFKTLELVTHNYWWPQMSWYIGIYIKTCDLCNRTKLQHRRPLSELHPSETPAEPWDAISIDFIVELPESHGYDTIMCIVDSDQAHAFHPDAYHHQRGRHGSPVPQGGLETPWNAPSSPLGQRFTVHGRIHT
jgi:hypothetical protein